MKVPEIKQYILKNIINILGWRTNRKIVVIESDDWGSIRMPSKEVYKMLLKEGLNANDVPYNQYDSLASESDLTNLFEILSGFKDKNGNPPIITANCVMVNPDFEKIKASDFQEYHYELFTETLKSYPAHANSFKLWQEGISNNFIFPQFHSREHLNVNRWMKALRENNKETRLAFDYGLFGLSSHNSSELRNHFMATLDYDEDDEILDLKLNIEEGLNLFEQVFGFRSVSFIAPCYTWSSLIEPILYNSGIRYLKGNFIQAEPDHSLDKLNYKRHYHYVGQTNNLGQYHLIRNCFFEPSQKENADSVNECLKEIDNAFKWNKPVSISSHRLNYIGCIHPRNTDRNLPLLKSLFTGILKRWPDVEFMTSNQLGDLISSTSIKIN